MMAQFLVCTVTLCYGGTTARGLTTAAVLRAYPYRWPVETHVFVAQETTTLEMPRAWTEQALQRRIRLSLLTGSLLQASAAATAPLAMGPWDRQPLPSARRLAHSLDIHAASFSALALHGVAPRNYGVIHKTTHSNELQQRETVCIGKTRAIKETWFSGSAKTHSTDLEYNNIVALQCDMMKIISIISK